ncbi:selenium cofactor biosynthesis protein YqeC [Candidatus Uabimicrobium sp. HlEnr_7]|uniref:selenium cofactor biosynthesis protein YqeC n=1 Tax=Candidatus Uabimicrobium helgolandensis TaxID=3095367 RepID=UPI0035584AAF
MSTNINWKQLLNLQSKEVISIVGAGGKTTLMFTLARQLSEYNLNVISTTTTKIFYPSPQETSIIIQGYHSNKPISFEQNKHITIINEILPNNKVKGFPANTIDAWLEIPNINYIIVEADGARRCDIKWPDITKEPVIPKSTTTTIAVIGGDCFSKVLSESHVFRAQLFAQKTQSKLGENLSLEAISRLFVNSDGLFANSPPNAKKIVFINKIHSDRTKLAISLAKIITKSCQSIKIFYGHLHPYISIKEFQDESQV